MTRGPESPMPLPDPENVTDPEQSYETEDQSVVPGPESPISNAEPPVVAAADKASRPMGKQNRRGRIKRAVGKTTAALAIAGGITLMGSQEADAAPLTATEPAHSSQEKNSGVDVSTMITTGAVVLSAAGAILSISSNTRERRRDRYYKVLENIGELNGEDRAVKLQALNSFVEHRSHRMPVFDTSLSYLRNRGTALKNIYRLHGDKPKELDAALEERRNSDRNAVTGFFKTLPTARKRARREGVKRRLKLAREEDKYDELEAATGGRPTREPARVDAKGVNLEGLNQVKRVNLSRVNLTGAWFRGLKFQVVNLQKARLSEAHLEGAHIRQCDLRGTDLRGAYFNNHKDEDPFQDQPATIEGCLIDLGTQLGNLPEGHPDAFKDGTITGTPEVILKNLRSKKNKLSEKQIVEKVREWKKNGLVVLLGSDPEYLSDEADGPDSTPPTKASS